MDVFGSEWARAWMREINADPAYREAGRGWRGAIVLRMWPEEETAGRALYVDLVDGECRAARVASAADEAAAPWLIGAPIQTWRNVMDGGVDPILGLVQGKLRLERGNLLKLVPYARAAKILLSAAARVPGVFPGDHRQGDSGDDVAAGTATGNDHPDGAPSILAVAHRAAGGPDRSLDHSILPMRIWHEAKKAGTWDPRDIELAADQEDWSRLADAEREVLLRLAALCRQCEAGITPALVRLLAVVSSRGRKEDELCLASFLMDEARHAELRDRFLVEVAGERGERGRVDPRGWSRLKDALAADTEAVSEGASPDSVARALTTSLLVVEGVLAGAAYHAWHEILERKGILPGMQRAIQYIKRDESRHQAWAVYMLGGLIAEHGDDLWSPANEMMTALAEPVEAVLSDVFAGIQVMPFGLEPGDLAAHAATQFRTRQSRLSAARTLTPMEIAHGEID